MLGHLAPFVYPPKYTLFILGSVLVELVIVVVLNTKLIEVRNMACRKV